MCWIYSYQVQEVQGEYVDTAGHGGQGTNDGGENAETTRTEQKVLYRRCIQKKTKSWFM